VRRSGAKSIFGLLSSSKTECTATWHVANLCKANMHVERVIWSGAMQHCELPAPHTHCGPRKQHGIS
jgi:hypothetical protein